MGISLKPGEVAGFYEVTRRTGGSWKAAGCPCRSSGRGREDVYDSAEVHRWLLAEAVGSGAEKDPELKAARLEILKTEGELRKLRLRLREGELVETCEIERTLDETFSIIRTAFDGLTPWAASELMALDREADLRELCFSIDGRLDQLLYSAYVNVRGALSTMAGRGKGAKVAAEAWRNVFGASWREQGDRDEATLRRDIEALMRRSNNETTPS